MLYGKRGFRRRRRFWLASARQKAFAGPFCNRSRETWVGMGLNLRNVLAKAAARSGIYSGGMEKARTLATQGAEYIAQGQFDDALRISEQLRTFDLYQSWRLKAQALSHLRPSDDYTEFWRSASDEVPRSGAFMRRYLDAALLAARADEAEAAMARLTRSGKLRAPDADYAIGLANLYLAQGDRAKAEVSISRLLTRLSRSEERAVAELRLSRMITLLFPAQVHVSSRAFVLEKLRATRIGEAAARSLDAAAVLEAALERDARQCLFDTDVLREPCEAFVALVRSCIAQGRPFSLIRLLDGESNAFGYPQAFADKFDQDAAERELVWWGKTLEVSRRDELNRRVAAAAEASDCVGLPTLSRILRDLKLDSGEDLSDSRTGRGLLAVQSAFARPERFYAFRSGTIASGHLHQDLERWKLYGQLILPGEEVVAVSCHARLGEVLRCRFGARLVHHVQVPPRHYSRTAFGDDQEGAAFSERIDETIAALGDWPKGRLVLVGAGYAGKIVVGEAKRRGGIVLDLGSIFDYWIGARTRSYQDIA